jgi:hypothetical protein
MPLVTVHVGGGGVGGGVGVVATAVVFEYVTLTGVVPRVVLADAAGDDPGALVAAGGAAAAPGTAVTLAPALAVAAVPVTVLPAGWVAAMTPGCWCDAGLDLEPPAAAAARGGVPGEPGPDVASANTPAPITAAAHSE